MYLLLMLLTFQFQVQAAWLCSAQLRDECDCTFCELMAISMHGIVAATQRAITMTWSSSRILPCSCLD